MIGVFIIPTGIGAEIGGHAGDATPAAKLLASCCDKLIVHPNVVNASDINEMSENMLYVEGSILDRFLEKQIRLQETTQNKILVVANAPFKNETVNAISASMVTAGIDVEFTELKTPLKMLARIEDGAATGKVYGWQDLVDQVQKYDFDALAIHTPIETSREIALNYYKNGGVNPWGGIEAKTSRLIATALNKPIAHAPIENVSPEDEELYLIFNKIVDPRIAPEAISNCYLHCVLKGLNKAPRISTIPHSTRHNLGYRDVDFLVTPDNCYGRPHKACEKAGIPVIVVRENRTLLSNSMPDNFIFVENYLEAAGVVLAMKTGIHFKSVRRPIEVPQYAI
jgi:hypothetical protein